MILIRSSCCGVLCLGLLVAPLAADEDQSELVNLTISLLADQDKDIRALGLEQVRTAAQGTAATERFAAQLSKLAPAAQVGLLSALADRGDPAARLAVLELLAKSEAESVRAAAIRALGFLGAADDVALLAESLAGESSAQRAAARQSLVDLSGEMAPARIVDVMKKAPAAVRVALIEILAARRAAVAVPDLLSEAVDNDARVRAAAMQALGVLAGPEHLPGMVQGVLKAAESRERAAAEKCVMFVTQRIKDPAKRADGLITAVGQLSPDEQRGMLSTLGRVGGPAALAIVEKAIGSSDPKPHEAGIRAISNWPDATIAARLQELATTDAHPSHRITALRALIRVAPLRDERSDEARLALLKKAMAMATRDAEKKLVLDRARTVRTVAALRFVLPYTDEARFAEQACLSVVELAHHRGLREPNKAEFDRALDKVLVTSKDPTTRDRAQRYKEDRTWVRPGK